MLDVDLEMLFEVLVGFEDAFLSRTSRSLSLSLENVSSLGDLRDTSDTDR